MRADSSMPITQIVVMIAIQTTPTAVTAKVESAALCQPTSRNEYRPAICARFAITMTSATMIAQPPSQPADGPIARVDPRERRAAVRVGAVHVVVGRGDQQHRHERQQQDRRRLQPDARDRDDEAERRGERVARRGRRDADHAARHEAQRILLQTLVADPGRSRGRGTRPRQPPWRLAYPDATMPTLVFGYGSLAGPSRAGRACCATTRAAGTWRWTTATRSPATSSTSTPRPASARRSTSRSWHPAGAGRERRRRVVFAVDDERLAALDRRERNYDRRDVPRARRCRRRRVWAYVGSAPGRARFAAGRAAGTAVVERASTSRRVPDVEPPRPAGACRYSGVT